MSALPVTLERSRLHFSNILPAIPTPTTAPTKQCDVLTGKLNDVDNNTATAAPSCVAYDFDGVKLVILEPTVLIVRGPNKIIPNT